jgi:N-acetyl-anhydromuramyl-L-alanine amidase AmpD
MEELSSREEQPGNEMENSIEPDLIQPEKNNTGNELTTDETEKISWGFQKSDNRSIDTVIIHSSYNSLGGDKYDLNKILDIYKSYGVSPHYIISREGKVYRLVEDKNIAYHAGESKVPDGRKNVNNFSLGIEIINSKTEGPSSAQYGSLNNLLNYLKNKYKLKYILGHSDIASGRKDDPWKFSWDKLK